MDCIRSLRFAPEVIAERYPLPVSGALAWQPTAEGHTAWIELPRLAAGAIVVPSFSLLDEADYGYRFELHAAGQHWPLSPIGTRVPGETVEHRAHGPVSTHLDCWHVHGELERAQLRLELRSAAEPRSYLLSCVARPLDLEAGPGSASSTPLPVPAVTQMSAAAGIRRRICSPACVTMVLGWHAASASLAEVAAACHDPVSGIYGVWPLAIHTASRYGVIGALEAFTDLDQTAPLLDAGLPIIATIRFARGQLRGAPLEASLGHLVVLTGLEGENVHVNDPAAEAPAEVARIYDRREFTAAWLDHRGIGYVLLAP